MKKGELRFRFSKWGYPPTTKLPVVKRWWYMTCGKNQINNQTNRILIVDDDEDQLEFLKWLLEEEGFLTATYSNPAQALSASAAQPFNAIVCDFLMPEMNGPEFICSIRKLEGNAKTPIVLLTAGSQTTTHSDIHSIPYKANAFCLKKQARETLLPTLRGLLS